MDDDRQNVTTNGTADRESECTSLPGYFRSLMVIDIITVLMGQPMTTKLLWLKLTSKKSKDILNLNLALFHSVQYLIFNMHVFFLLFHVHAQEKLLFFLNVFVQIGGPMNLTLICLERYIAVIHPTYFPQLNRYRCREVCVACVWLCALPIPLLMLPTDKILSDAVKINLFNISYFIMMVMIGIMMYSSVTVARALKQSTVGKDVLHPLKKRALVTIVVVSNTALFCYIPVTLLQRVNMVNPNRFTCVITPLSLFFLSAASVVHPLFYLSTQGKLCNCCKREYKPK